MTTLNRVALGRSALLASPIGLGTMTFGEQTAEPEAHRILDRALERGINLLDAAEMYPVPPRSDTCGETERILGRWLAARPGARDRVLLATKVAGPSRGLPWVRGEQAGLTPAEIQAACEGSLRRLQTDVIDLYQIHWPARNAPAFGALYFDERNDHDCTSLHEQLQALGNLVRSGKVRAIGLSNETPYGVHEFVRLAEQHGLPRIATVQNPYGLLNRSWENALDETCHHLGVGLLAYSPLAFGLLTGKYDDGGFHTPTSDAAKRGRMALYERMQSQRWGRPEALDTARRYNALARQHGLTPTQLALAFCYHHRKVASTLIGVTTLAQLDECLDAWNVHLSPELLTAVDAIRWQHRDPAQ